MWDEDFFPYQPTKVWRYCIICNNRTRSLKRIGFYSDASDAFSYAVCGDRCHSLTLLLSKDEVRSRISDLCKRHGCVR